MTWNGNFFLQFAIAIPRNIFYCWFHTIFLIGARRSKSVKWHNIHEGVYLTYQTYYGILCHKINGCQIDDYLLPPIFWIPHSSRRRSILNSEFLPTYPPITYYSGFIEYSKFNIPIPSATRVSNTFNVFTNPEFLHLVKCICVFWNNNK